MKFGSCSIYIQYFSKYSLNSLIHVTLSCSINFSFSNFISFNDIVLSLNASKFLLTKCKGCTDFKGITSSLSKSNYLMYISLTYLLQKILCQNESSNVFAISMQILELIGSMKILLGDLNTRNRAKLINISLSIWMLSTKPIQRFIIDGFSTIISENRIPIDS